MKKRSKILIVDDEEINQVYLQYLLEKKYDIFTCNSVNNFYSLINYQEFDMILMDINLHDSKDGISLTRELRKNPKYKSLPIFILTSLNNRQTKTDAFNAGADKFFAKPVDGKILINYVEEYLNKNNPFKF